MRTMTGRGQTSPSRPGRARTPRLRGRTASIRHAEPSFHLTFGGDASVPALVINPAEDRAFVAWTLWLVGARADASIMSPTVLEVALHRRYPEAIVRRRDLSGELGETWYVYRDGHWSPPRRVRRRATT